MTWDMSWEQLVREVEAWGLRASKRASEADMTWDQLVKAVEEIGLPFQVSYSLDPDIPEPYYCSLWPIGAPRKPGFGTTVAAITPGALLSKAKEVAMSLKAEASE